ncbi:hypothetical protein ABPG77_005436 [Micractinium sp. CCAP 211/92]
MAKGKNGKAKDASKKSHKHQSSGHTRGTVGKLASGRESKRESVDSRLQQDVQSDDEEFYVELMSAGSGSEDEQSDDSEAEVAEVRPPPRQRHEHGNSRAGREATSLAAGIGPAPAAGKRKRGLQREAQPAAAAEAEDVQEDCPARKRRGSAKRPSSSKKKQPAAPKAGERAAEATSPVAEAQPSERQAKQQRSKSRTPAAAAPALEVSASPASAAKAAATRPHPRQSQSPVAAQQPADQQQQEQQPGGKGCGASGASDPAGAARNLLVRRLKAPSSQEAATMQLRPRLQEAHDSLLDSLTNTVELGHNNSLLVVGPRGCGKTLVTERALAALQARFNTDPRDPVVGVVRLSGLAHAQEVAAFKEASRQLCQEFKYTFSRAASVAENIEFVRGMLGALARSVKSVVFVLDEFDLFAAKRSKQTLLYNLLDALQTSGMQAAVIGLTCRHDVVEMLEKRVKSRFSHRKLDLSLPTSVLPVAAREDGETGKRQEAQDGALGVLQSMLILPPGFPHADWAAQWNASVGAACGGAALRSALQRCINIYPSLRVLASIADVAAASALRAGQLSTSALLAAVERQLGQRKAMVNSIASLPILDLALLVAVHRLTAKGCEDLNFEMAHHEFQRYAVRADVDKYSRTAVAKAWDHLLSEGLVAFVDPRSEGRAGSRPYAAAYLLAPREEVAEGLLSHWNCPQALREWFRREGGLGTTAGQFL